MPLHARVPSSILTRVRTRSFPRDVQTVLWDAMERTTFVAIAVADMHTYAYFPVTMHGPQISHVGSTERYSQVCCCFPY
jgi:hypothetical protein